MVGNWGATPPASKKITKRGEQVRWASMAAAQGTPVPTATVRPSSRARAAQQIISSMALKSGMRRCLDTVPGESGQVAPPANVRVGQLELHGDNQIRTKVERHGRNLRANPAALDPD